MKKYSIQACCKAIALSILFVFCLASCGETISENSFSEYSSISTVLSSTVSSENESQAKYEDVEMAFTVVGSWMRIGLFEDGEIKRTSQIDDEPIHFVIFDADGTFDAQYVPGSDEIPYGSKGSWEPFDADIDDFEHSYLLSVQSDYTYELENGYVKDKVESDSAGTILVFHSDNFSDYLIWKDSDTSDKLYVYKNVDNKNADSDGEYDNYKPNVSAGLRDENSGRTGTLVQQNALERANSYLKSSAFSYDGLVEQLEFEGFSHSEAVYGADLCGADWKDQALKKALSYLRSSSFSESGLIEQLEFEGFTSTEAKYGVDNCGADWNEQAAKKAASYLRHSSFSRSDLIDQLEFEGFTYAQAVYGVEQNGY